MLSHPRASGLAAQYDRFHQAVTSAFGPRVWPCRQTDHGSDLAADSSLLGEKRM